ncbi:hypothetical protein WICPIJ_001796 [Wickerhamomyces pijperi]|uniref:Uncharacterized protein n=1 Tax=Wickerhamomyces pijperi TaxID=599730 RepID=A0A9P8TQS4_WICPI|nr:hypothetical protein WICPIJ_001796 [Wickerhamomyces pijperi]
MARKHASESSNDFRGERFLTVFDIKRAHLSVDNSLEAAQHGMREIQCISGELNQVNSERRSPLDCLFVDGIKKFPRLAPELEHGLLTLAFHDTQIEQPIDGVIKARNNIGENLHSTRTWLKVLIECQSGDVVIDGGNTANKVRLQQSMETFQTTIGVKCIV